MFSQRQLICEANPFTWMARKKIGGGVNREPTPVRSSIGRGIKKGLGMAFNNPITRGATELQKALVPGSGKTRQAIARGASRVLGVRPYEFRRYGVFGKRYSDMKSKNPKQYADDGKNINRNIVSSNGRKFKSVTNKNMLPTPTNINGKTSYRFGLVDKDGKIIAIFYPFIKLEENKEGSGFINVKPRVNTDTGFTIWNAVDDKFEVIPQRLSETPFPKEPNFVAF